MTEETKALLVGIATANGHPDPAAWAQAVEAAMQPKAAETVPPVTETVATAAAPGEA